MDSQKRFVFFYSGKYKHSSFNPCDPALNRAKYIHHSWTEPMGLFWGISIWWSTNYWALVTMLSDDWNDNDNDDDEVRQVDDADGEGG